VQAHRTATGCATQLIGTTKKRCHTSTIVTIIGSLFLSLTVAPAAISVESKADAELKHGQALLQQKKYTEAIDYFDRAVEHDNKLKLAYLLRGESKEGLKRYSDAVDDYNAYQLLEPNDSSIFMRLSHTYTTMGKYNVALSYMSKALLLKPKDGNMYIQRAAIYDKLGKADMASVDREVAHKLGVTAEANKPKPVAHKPTHKVQHHAATRK
jgi:tetratricopeptide (TPR) repeat protein